MTPERLLELYASRKFRVFDGSVQPNLNLFGLRRTPGHLDEFDDVFGALYRAAGAWRVESWPCTLDPGKPGIDHPTRRDGTAQIAEGQHRFTFGRHHDEYECLSPVGEVAVLRYLNEVDFLAGRGTPSTSSSTQIHHARSGGTSTVVGPWSLGCGVLANDTTDYPRLMELCHAQDAAGLGDQFTVSVFNARTWEMP